MNLMCYFFRRRSKTSRKVLQTERNKTRTNR